jgi:DNA-binding response OmpR family regulator
MHRILIVDQNRYLRRLYALELGAEGYEVVVAANEDEALGRLELTPPDLVVMDIGACGFDGAGSLAKFLSKISNLPVILNTAYDTSETRFMAWVADASLIKSSDLTELKNKIHELLPRPDQHADTTSLHAGCSGLGHP